MLQLQGELIMVNDAKARSERINSEMLDSFDEELELEIDDDRLARLLDEASEHPEPGTLDRRIYFKELFRMQGELVKLQDWVQYKQLKVVVLFEGRDSAGKGGVIKRITQRLNPRVCRVAALPAPNERERTQWYFQRFVPFPCRPAVNSRCSTGPGTIAPASSASWAIARKSRPSSFLNAFRAIRTDAGPRSGIILLKYWFSITDEVQQFRFLMRMHDPLKQWKLSPMDVEARSHWEQYTKAKEIMLERTHIPEAPWWIVEAVDQKKARLNCITHLLGQIPYRVRAPQLDRVAGARPRSRISSRSHSQGNVLSRDLLTRLTRPVDELSRAVRTRWALPSTAISRACAGVIPLQYPVATF